MKEPEPWRCRASVGGLHFYNYFSLNHEIQTLPGNDLALVVDVNLDLLLNGEPPSGQLETKGSLVNRFKKPWSENAM